VPEAEHPAAEPGTEPGTAPERTTDDGEPGQRS
jgi:hypothetical protein